MIGTRLSTFQADFCASPPSNPISPFLPGYFAPPRRPGYSLTGDTVPEEDLQPYVQAALDQIEYALGDVSTPGGKLRAEHGHPEPFTNTKYIEIGNEDFFGPEVRDLFLSILLGSVFKLTPPIRDVSASTVVPGLPMEGVPRCDQVCVA